MIRAVIVVAIGDDEEGDDATDPCFLVDDEAVAFLEEHKVIALRVHGMDVDDTDAAARDEKKVTTLMIETGML